MLLARRPFPAYAFGQGCLTPFSVAGLVGTMKGGFTGEDRFPLCDLVWTALTIIGYRALLSRTQCAHF
jgi:hypothetical protein